MTVERALDECFGALREGELTPAGCAARYPALQAELEPLLRVASRLQAAGTLRASPVFRYTSPLRLRRLLATGPANAGRARTVGLPRPHPRRWATAVALALVAWLVIGAAVVQASAAALPGDPLYRVKRAAEAVWLAASLSDQGDTRLRLALAERRMGEMDALAGTGRSEDLAQAAAGYVESLAALEVLLGRLDRQQDAWLVEAVLVAADADSARLLALADTVSEPARSPVERALGASQAVWEQAREVLEPDTRGQGPTPAPKATESPTGLPRSTATATPPVTPTPGQTPRSESVPSMATSTASTPAPTPRPTLPLPASTAAPTPQLSDRATPTGSPTADLRAPSPTPSPPPARTPKPSPDPADRATPQSSPTLAPSRAVTTTVSSEADGVPAVTR